MLELEVQVNDPFDALKIASLFSDREDLKWASPRSTYPFDPAEWTNHFQAHTENCSLLFLLDQKIIGHTAFLPKDELLFLCYVVLRPEHRRGECAREMIRLSEEFCRLNYAHDELFLNVDRKNERAIRLYKKVGYEVCEEFKEKFQMKKFL